MSFIPPPTPEPYRTFRPQPYSNKGIIQELVGCCSFIRNRVSQLNSLREQEFEPRFKKNIIKDLFTTSVRYLVQHRVLPPRHSEYREDDTIESLYAKYELALRELLELEKEKERDLVGRLISVQTEGYRGTEDAAISREVERIREDFQQSYAKVRRILQEVIAVCSDIVAYGDRRSTTQSSSSSSNWYGRY